MEVIKMECGGILLDKLDGQQVKRLIHMVWKYQPRTEISRKFKSVLNQYLCESYLKFCKGQVKRIDIGFSGEIAALHIYDVVSSYTDEETEFTRVLTARIHNAIDSPIDELIKSF